MCPTRLDIPADFVKVRVTSEGHYHVLSRYRVAKQLQLAGLDEQRANLHALALKKALVDDGKQRCACVVAQSPITAL